MSLMADGWQVPPEAAANLWRHVLTHGKWLAEAYRSASGSDTWSKEFTAANRRKEKSGPSPAVCPCYCHLR